MSRGDSSHRREPNDSVRGLTGSGPSKVGVVKAMRARDVSRERTGPEPERRPQEVEGGSGKAGSSPVDS